MGTFIFSYRPARDAVASDDAFAEWGRWFATFAGSIVDPGKPIFERTSLGTTGETTDLGGYTLVRADDLAGAVAIARGCPALQHGGGIEVGVLADMPTDPAAQAAAAQGATA